MTTKKTSSLFVVSIDDLSENLSLAQLFSRVSYYKEIIHTCFIAAYYIKYFLICMIQMYAKVTLEESTEQDAIIAIIAILAILLCISTIFIFTPLWWKHIARYNHSNPCNPALHLCNLNKVQMQSQVSVHCFSSYLDTHKEGCLSKSY